MKVEIKVFKKVGMLKVRKDHFTGNLLLMLMKKYVYLEFN